MRYLCITNKSKMIQEGLIFFATLQIKCPLLFSVWGNGLKAPPATLFTLKSVLLCFGGCHPLHYSSSAVTLAGVSRGLAGLASWPLVCLSFLCSSTRVSFLPRSSSIFFLVLPFIARFPLPSPHPPSPSRAAVDSSPFFLLPSISFRGKALRDW